MRRFLFAFIIFLIWFYFGIRYYICNVKNLCDTTPANTTIVTQKNIPETPPKKEDLSHYMSFLISKNSSVITQKDSLKNPLQTHFDYLNTHQDEELLITSFHNIDEHDSMAIARAKILKSKLTKFGSNSDRIVTKTALKDFTFDTNQQYHKGFYFTYQKISAEKMALIDKGIINKTLYSGFGSKTFKPDNTLNAYALELKNYLVKYPTKKVMITGHTDSSGEAEANQWFGRERAKNVMEYFVSQGIDPSKMSISSKGESAPIATNATVEGRRLNRRIEINVNN